MVGSSADDWGILVLEADGGIVRYRPIRDLQAAAWESAVELPPFTGAYPVAGSSVALVDADGDVSRYDPSEDLLETLERVDGDPIQWFASGTGDAFVNPDRGEVLVVSRDRAWRYDVARPVEWVGAVDDGIALLLPDGSVWLVPAGSTEPSTEATLQVRAPGVVTAWGRRLVLVDAESDRTLRAVTLDPLETAGRVELGGRVTALATSPSSHQLYAGTADPPGVDVVNRFSFTSRRLVELERPPVEIRTSLFGEFLLLFDGERSWKIQLESGERTPLPGRWNADLPLGLPDGRVIVRQDSEVLLVEADGRAGDEPLSVGVDTRWLPVRWTPLARLAANEIEGRPVPAPPGRAAARPAQGRQAELEEVPDQESLDESEPQLPDVPAGFYAIVGSARQRGGIEALVLELESAGYPIEVQTTTDRAGEEWHRGLVGPFDSRAEAEAAARQLQRERQLQSWVTGIGVDG